MLIFHFCEQIACYRKKCLYLHQNLTTSLPGNDTGNSVACSRGIISFIFRTSNITFPSSEYEKWLVAYVRLHHEKKTAERLTAMNIENFLPVQEEIRQWTYRKKKIKRVVIPMMIFVHVDAAERSQVLTLSAISRYMVLHGEHTPAVIPDEQMERFKFMLDYSDEAVEMCTAPLAPGELIRVVKGPLKGLEGELVEVDGKAKVVVRLDLLGCAGVDMPVGFVEKMK